MYNKFPPKIKTKSFQDEDNFPGSEFLIHPMDESVSGLAAAMKKPIRIVVYATGGLFLS